MGGRPSVRIGLGVVAIGIGLLSAGCFAGGPPAAPASLAISPSPADFPTSLAPTYPMPNVVLTITNTGGHPAQIDPVLGVSVYSVPSDTCTSLAPGGSCTVTIQFCPSSAGQYNSTLDVTGHDATSGAPLHASTLLSGAAT